jgi:hypothetical protein
VCTIMCNCADISVSYHHTYILEIYMYITPPGSDWTGSSLITTAVRNAFASS